MAAETKGVAAHLPPLLVFGMPDNTSSMKEDQKGPKNREIIQGLGYSKNTVRIKLCILAYWE